MALSKFSADLKLLSVEVFDWLSSHKLKVLVGAVPITVIALYWKYHRADEGLPPGPRFFLLSDFFKPKSYADVERNCVELRAKHGDVVSGRMLSTVFIVLNSYELAREAYVTHGDCLSGRLQMQGNSPLRIDRARGLLNADGEIWQEHRRFVLSSLRDFGFGKGRSETMIQHELESLTAYLLQAGEGGSKALDPREALQKATTDVISSLVFGQRCGTDDEQEMRKIRALMRDLNENSINKIPLIVLFIMGFLMRLPGDPFRVAKRFSQLDKILDYVEGKIDDRRKKHSDANEADLIDSYLTIQAEHERNEPGKHSFTNPQMSRVILELFLAGSDTVAIMMRWSLMLMAMNSEVQANVQRELGEVLEGRVPKVSDRNLLKYTDAVIHEVFRYAVMLPVGGLLHRVTNEVHVGGHRFPKDAMVKVNLFAIFRDPKIWPHPNQFNPVNFLDPSSNNCLVNTDYLIPFMIGRRACPGESLAKQEMFLLFAGILQRYTVKFDPESRQPTMNDAVVTTFNCVPPDFKLLFVPNPTK